jgi:hypothetical protein
MRDEIWRRFRASYGPHLRPRIKVITFARRTRSPEHFRASYNIANVRAARAQVLKKDDLLTFVRLAIHAK